MSQRNKKTPSLSETQNKASQSFTFEDALTESLSYFNGDELAAQTFVSKYALQDGSGNYFEKTPEEMHRRLAAEFSRIEQTYPNPMSEEEIFSLLDQFKYVVPQGSPMSGIGNQHKLQSVSNCFLAGTQVLTTNGVKPIEKVVEGDKVVTHTGRVQTVLQTHKNLLGDRDLFTFKAFRTPEITVTGNHKFWSITQEQLEWGESPQWNSIEHLRKGDWIAIPKNRESLESESVFDLADIVKDLDFEPDSIQYQFDVQRSSVMMVSSWKQTSRSGSEFEAQRETRPVNRFWEVDQNFARFLGLWYGDGCVFSQDKASSRVRGITFTFGAHEKHLIGFVSEFGSNLFGIPADVNEHNADKDGTVQVVFHSGLVGRVFEHLWGRSYNSKRFHPSMYTWDGDRFKSLLAGLVESDGTVTANGDVRVVMGNDQLIDSFFHMARSFGMPLGRSGSVVKYEGEVRTYARLDFPKHSAILDKVQKYYEDDRIEKARAKCESVSRLKEIDGVTFVRLDKKTRCSETPEWVYTFGVEEDHSYSVQGLVAQNCFVIESPFDSYGGILTTDQEQVQIMKRRGGVGFDISPIRPKGLGTANAAQTTDGIEIFMDRFSNSCREVAQGGRRGALMISLDVHHPQVRDFIKIKRDLTRVTGANISLRLSDEFMEAVMNNSQVQLRWPCDPNAKHEVEEWVDAKPLWDEIIEAAHATAEPGLLFWGNCKKYTPSDIYEDEGFGSTSTNPCGEIILSPYDSCRLLVVNLAGFIQDPFTDHAQFDWEKYQDVVFKAQRLMDDMIDIELEQVDKILAKIDSDPEPDFVKEIERNLWQKIREAAVRGRRTGLGVTAVGDAVAMMGMVYGTDESIELVEKIYRDLAIHSYRSSVVMAKERGTFPIFSLEKEKGHPFLERIWEAGGPELRAMYEKYGRRNIANTTTAPCGSVSILTQTTSGIEPAYTLMYTRRKKINPNDINAKVDFVDELGDKWSEFTVRHHGFMQWQQVTGKKDSDIEQSPYWGGTSNDVDWVQKVKLQGAAQRWICHAISNCVAAGESLIFTDQGLLDIEELAGHAPLKAFAPIDYEVSSVNKEGESAAITQAYNNGIADVIRLQCGGGRFITCTPNHQVVVLDENYNQVWKRAEDIEPGDLLVGRKGLNLWNQKASQGSLAQLVGSKFDFDRSSHHKEVKIPTRMTSKLARFMGYMCSDGFISDTGFGLSQNNNDAAQDFVEIVEDLFGVEVSSTKDLRAEDLHSWRANSKELSAFCSWLGLTRHDTDMLVPLAIRRSSKRFAKEFLRGLTLDGHVSQDNLYVMTSISRRFLEQTQALLLNMGIDAHVEQCHTSSEVTFPAGNTCLTKDAWTLVISHSGEAARFLSMVGYAEDRKAQEAATKFRRASRVKLIGEIPDFGLRARFRQEHLPKIRSNSLYEKFNSLTNLDKQGRLLCRDSLLEMADLGLEVPEILLDTTYTFRRVESVTSGRAQTYDVTVPQGHAYIANGFVSHNTTNLPTDTPPEVVADVYLTGYKAGCKGVTVYRDGSRTGVLVQSKFHQHDAPRRPESLPCEVHRSTIKVADGKYEDWLLFVGLLEGKPYEIFGGTTENVELPKKVTEGYIVKRRFKAGGKYDFVYGDPEDPFKIKDIVKQFGNPERGWATRMLSLALRHGAPIQYVVEQLQRDKGSDLWDFQKVLARVLKKYIADGTESKSEKVCPECGEEGSLRYQEGCLSCQSCGMSKCG